MLKWGLSIRDCTTFRTLVKRVPKVVLSHPLHKVKLARSVLRVGQQGLVGRAFAIWSRLSSAAGTRVLREKWQPKRTAMACREA